MSSRTGNLKIFITLKKCKTKKNPKIKKKMYSH